MKLETVIEPEYVSRIDQHTVVGIDIGSRGAKAVLLHKGEMYMTITETGINMQDTANELLEDLFRQSGLTIDDVHYIVGTGYGRISMSFPNTLSDVVTEISCHAMGCHYLNKGTKTIIDIGGQDSKAIKVNPANGKVEEFIMNDKCAAGSGRFLEKVALLLGYTLDEVGPASLRAKNELDISSQCVVFAESEVVSLKVKGTTAEDIAAAINFSIARRVKALINRIGIEPEILFSGGVSNNPGMRYALEKVLGEKIKDIKLDMVYAGALGAAIFANDYYEAKLQAQQ
jgi:predicted CoA-substrate-specific enzyme activase